MATRVSTRMVRGIWAWAHSNHLAMFSAVTAESPGEDRVSQPNKKGQHLNRKHLNWVWWHLPVIPELGRLKQGITNLRSA